MRNINVNNPSMTRYELFLLDISQVRCFDIRSLVYVEGADCYDVTNFLTFKVPRRHCLDQNLKRGAYEDQTQIISKMTDSIVERCRLHMRDPSWNFYYKFASIYASSLTPIRKIEHVGVPPPPPSSRCKNVSVSAPANIR